MSLSKKFPGVQLLLVVCILSVVLWVQATANAADLQQSAQEGQQLFQEKCQSCHTIGGGNRIGPDLQGVTTRQDLAWLERFITAPDKVIASGDPVANALLKQFNNIPMPNLGLSKDQVASLLAYLENPDSAGSGPAAPTAPPVAIPTGGNAINGRAIFSGNQPLQNGGIACIACHSTTDAGVLGGGSIGPDLTQVFTRYGDAGLASALTSLPFPTMAGIFGQRPLTPQEQADLYAYFSEVNAQPARVLSAGIFWGVGALGAAVLFLLMLRGWPRQRMSNAERLRLRK